MVLFVDCFECRNPGGIYGGQSINDLGFAYSQTRNPTLVSLLEIEGTAENRHSGIPAIRGEAQSMDTGPQSFSIGRFPSLCVSTPCQSMLARWR